MARRILARMSTIFLTASALAACERAPTGTSTNAVLATDVSFARGSSKGGGKPGGVSTQPTMAITPTQLSLGVGQQATLSVTYWDSRGNIIPVTDDKPTYYGCRQVVDTDPDCWSIVSIVPGGPNNREATVTGKTAGTVLVYASDGLGTWVTSTVTVQ